MNARIHFLSTLAVVLLSAGLLHAKDPSDGTKQPTTSIRPELLAAEQTVSMTALEDAMYDYEVYSAPDVSGQTEFVVIARFADDGQWDYVHRYTWIGTPDRGFTQSDQGVWKFTTWWSARQAAENLMDDGEITDYEIIEQAKEPQWTYEDTFDTRAQAEDFAEELEHWSQQFGVPHLTKIVSVSTLNLSTRTLK